MIVASNNKYRIYANFILVVLFIFAITKIIRGASTNENAGGIWNLIQLFFVAIGIWIAIRNNKILAESNVWIFFLFSLYVFFHSFIGYAFSVVSESMSMSLIFQWIMLLCPIMTLLIFYNIGLNYSFLKLSKLYVVGVFFVFVLLLIILMRFRYSFSIEYFTVADSYYLLSFSPLLLVFFKKKFKWIVFILLTIIFLLSGKRAGVLVICSMLLVQYFKPSFFAIVRLLILIVGFYLISNWIVDVLGLNIFDRMENIMEDGGSGRDVRYAFIIDEMLHNSSIGNIIFGHGSGEAARSIRTFVTHSLSGGQVHNDFLEIVYDYGVIALFLYLYFFVKLVKTSIKMYKRKFPYYKEFLMLIILVLFLAMFSFYFIMPLFSVVCSACFGIFLAEWNIYKNQKIYMYDSCRC